MVTNKIRAIIALLRCKSFNLYARVGEDHVTHGAGSGDLSDMMMLVVQLKRDVIGITSALEAAATEAGELQLLIELRKTIEELENGGN